MLIGLVALGISALLAFSVLSRSDWDVTVFTAFGEEAGPTREYAEARLGEVYLRPSQGHDGKFFFVQANDPWVLNSEEHAETLDLPLYRSQRMFYPVLAGGAGFFGPHVVVWSMLIVNLIAMGFGSWAVAELARDMGGSPMWGLAFVLNLGLVSEVNIGGAGVVAAALAFAAAVMLMRDRLAIGIVFLALAALSREVMLIGAAGAAFWMWRLGRKRPAMATFGIPLLTVIIWAGYLRLQITPNSEAPDVQGIGLPFVGLIQAFERWIEDPFDLAVGIVVVLLLVLFTRRVLISGQLVGWMFLGFVPLALVLTRQVWTSYFDITRAIAPAITAFVLLVVLSHKSAPDRTLVHSG